MGNALNLWEIQAEVWATGKYPILSSYHSEEDLHKKFIIDKFLNDNNICLNNDVLNIVVNKLAMVRSSESIINNYLDSNSQ